MTDRDIERRRKALEEKYSPAAVAKRIEKFREIRVEGLLSKKDLNTNDLIGEPYPRVNEGEPGNSNMADQRFIMAAKLFKETNWPVEEIAKVTGLHPESLRQRGAELVDLAAKAAKGLKGLGD